MTSTANEASTESIFAGVLRTWEHGIDAHDTAETGSASAEDTLSKAAIRSLPRGARP